MKTLYIVRHAKSSWDFPHLSDHDRPLNNRGKKAAPVMGKRLKTRNIYPDRVVSSTAKRARNTCFKMMREIGFPEDDVILDEDLYDFGMSGILDVIHRQRDANSLMIYGHNPAFTSLANYLGNLDIDNIPTAGMVALEFDIKNWSGATQGTGELVFFDYPKKEFTIG